MPLLRLASIVDPPPLHWPQLSEQSASPRRGMWRRDACDAGRPIVSYIGWHGRGNIGDDAIYDAVRSQLPGSLFVDLPLLAPERMYAAATGLNRWLPPSSLLVGGGTIVGRSRWREFVARGLNITGSNDSFAIGIGVEDPAFQGHLSGSENGELERWVPILSRFHSVSVRGPRSAELLADVGLDVRVSGDPALLLPRPDWAPEDGVIGVNLGFGDDLWGHDPDTLANELGSAMKQLSAQGYRFVGILMNADDKEWTERVLDGTNADIVRPQDATAAAAAFARCSLAIVSRLHAGILASLSETPLIVVEYQPKCRDFALSIDDERSLIRTDVLRGGEVVDRVRAALAEAPAIRAKTRAAVADLRQRLESDYAEVRSRLGLAE
jgi:hypothetical protein